MIKENFKLNYVDDNSVFYKFVLCVLDFVVYIVIYFWILDIRYIYWYDFKIGNYDKFVLECMKKSKFCSLGFFGI